MKFLAFKIIIVACLAFYGMDYAAVPNPPQIECTTDCVDPPSGGTGTYDLGTLPAFVQDIEWPQDPQITFERTISSNSEFQAALSTNGQRSLVTSGTYSGGSVSCSDCEFVLASGVTINGNLSFRGNRIKWFGGTVNGGPMDQTGTGDVLIDNVHVITNGDLNNFSGPASGFNRVALINSTLEVTNGQSVGDWGLYIQQNSGSQLRGRNLIVANVRIESTGQNNRFQDVENLVIVDSYFNSNNTSSNGLRMHHGLQDVFMRDTVVVGSNITNGTDTQITNGVFENITRYHTLNNFFDNGIGNNTINVQINNSQCHTTATAMLGQPPNLGVASGSNPPIQSWNGSSLPSAASVGANH